MGIGARAAVKEAGVSECTAKAAASSLLALRKEKDKRHQSGI